LINLKNKVVLITGASTGIGRELAKQFAKEGCKLALLARGIENLQKTEVEVSMITNSVESFKCDVTNLSSIKTVLTEIIQFYGNIDIAVLNAGISFNNKWGVTDAEAAEEVVDTNILGIVYYFQELTEGFISRGGGIFVGVSSLADVRGFPGSGIYCASKAAATVFLESKRIELKPYNIKVITVKPGFVNTPMTKKNKFYMPFLMNPEKAAEIILKGIKKGKKVIQFPLPTVLGSKLLKILPSSLFDLFASKIKANK